MAAKETEELEQEFKRIDPRAVLVVSTRAALRAVPALSALLNRQGKFKGRGSTREILPLFRALHCSWLESVIPESVDERVIVDAAEAAESAARRNGSEGREAFFVPAYAAYAAAGNNSPYTAAVAVSRAPAAMGHAAFLNAYPAGRRKTSTQIEMRTREASEQDLAKLADGVSPYILVTQPLWTKPKGQLAWMRNAWSGVKDALHASDEKWHVWTDWYEARLAGKPFQGSLEIDKAYLPFEAWSQGPAFLNNEVARIISEKAEDLPQPALDFNDPVVRKELDAAKERGYMSYEDLNRLLPARQISDDEAHDIISTLSGMGIDLRHQETGASEAPSADVIPAQQTSAVQFGSTRDGPIDLAPVTSPSEHLFDREGRGEDYFEIRIKAVELNTLGANRLGHLQGSLNRFLDLPERIADVRTKLFWSRANTLRIHLSAHEEAFATQKERGEPDERLIESSAAALLKDLVETINVFMAGDPNLLELDAIRPGPKELEVSREELDILRPLLRDVANSQNVATSTAQDVIEEQASKISHGNADLSARQGAEFGRRSLQNFVGELLRRAYAPIRSLSKIAKSESEVAWKGIREGAYRAAGAAVITGGATDVVGVTNFSGAIIEFVVRHAQTLIAYVTKAFQNPTLVEIINLIARYGS